MTIRFYRTNEPYGCFSNFSRHGFELDGQDWPTVEHYYQAQKFAGAPHAEEIRLTLKPMDVHWMGQDPQRPLRADWDQVKDDVLRRATLRKFETHADIRAILLATGDEPLVEASPYDAYWGAGPDGAGLNRFGQLLGEVRELLREREAATKTLGARP